jgi:dipeptidyl aminopeptidase/acylaminoacyl peptidase
MYSIHIGGQAPWEFDEHNIKNRAGSPIWHMQHVKTPVLIIHGENDDRVDISRARLFWHGCLHHGVSCEMVVYPKEGHGMFPPFERGHYFDELKRIKSFYDQHLQGGKNIIVPPNWFQGSTYRDTRVHRQCGKYVERRGWSTVPHMYEFE